MDKLPTPLEHAAQDFCRATNTPMPISMRVKAAFIAGALWAQKDLQRALAEALEGLDPIAEEERP